MHRQAAPSGKYQFQEEKISVLPSVSVNDCGLPGNTNASSSCTLRKISLAGKNFSVLPSVSVNDCGLESVYFSIQICDSFSEDTESHYKIINTKSVRWLVTGVTLFLKSSVVGSMLGRSSKSDT